MTTAADPEENYDEEYNKYNYQEQKVDKNKLMNLIQKADMLLTSRNYMRAIEIYEKCITIYIKLFGQETKEFQEFFNNLMIRLNSISLELINEDETPTAYNVLKRCEEFSNPSKVPGFPNLRVLTFNHLACCLRRQNKLKSAMRYLENSFKIITYTNLNDYYGMTNLNMCAIYSQRNNHLKALEHARNAVFEFSHTLLSLNPSNFPNEEEYQTIHSENIRFLGISYYNLGVEEEFFGNTESAIAAYEKAYKLIEENIGPADPSAEKFKSQYLALRDQYLVNMYKSLKKDAFGKARVDTGLQKAQSVNGQIIRAGGNPSGASYIKESQVRPTSSKKFHPVSGSNLTRLSSATTAPKQRTTSAHPDTLTMHAPYNTNMATTNMKPIFIGARRVPSPSTTNKRPSSAFFGPNTKKYDQTPASSRGSFGFIPREHLRPASQDKKTQPAPSLLSSVASQKKVGLYKFDQPQQAEKREGKRLPTIEVETDSDIFRFEDEGVLSWDSCNEELEKRGKDKETKKSTLKMSRMNFLNSILNFSKQNRPQTVAPDFFRKSQRDSNQIEIRSINENSRPDSSNFRFTKKQEKQENGRRIGSAAPKTSTLFSEDRAQEFPYRQLRNNQGFPEPYQAKGNNQKSLKELDESARKIQQKWRRLHNQVKNKGSVSRDEPSFELVLETQQHIRVERGGELIEKGKLFALSAELDKVNLNLNFTARSTGSPLLYTLRLQAFFDDFVDPETNQLYPEKVSLCIQKAQAIAKRFSSVLVVQNGLLIVENRNAIHSILDDLDKEPSDDEEPISNSEKMENGTDPFKNSESQSIEKSDENSQKRSEKEQKSEANFGENSEKLKKTEKLEQKEMKEGQIHSDKDKEVRETSPLASDKSQSGPSSKEKEGNEEINLATETLRTLESKELAKVLQEVNNDEDILFKFSVRISNDKFLFGLKRVTQGNSLKEENQKEKGEDPNETTKGFVFLYEKIGEDNHDEHFKDSERVKAIQVPEHFGNFREELSSKENQAKLVQKLKKMILFCQKTSEFTWNLESPRSSIINREHEKQRSKTENEAVMRIKKEWENISIKIGNENGAKLSQAKEIQPNENENDERNDEEEMDSKNNGEIRKGNRSNKNKGTFGVEEEEIPKKQNDESDKEELKEADDNQERLKGGDEENWRSKYSIQTIDEHSDEEEYSVSKKGSVLKKTNSSKSKNESFNSPAPKKEKQEARTQQIKSAESFPGSECNEAKKGKSHSSSFIAESKKRRHQNQKEEERSTKEKNKEEKSEKGLKKSEGSVSHEEDQTKRRGSYISLSSQNSEKGPSIRRGSLSNLSVEIPKKKKAKVVEVSKDSSLSDDQVLFSPTQTNGRIGLEATLEKEKHEFEPDLIIDTEEKTENHLVIDTDKPQRKLKGFQGSKTEVQLQESSEDDSHSSLGGDLPNSNQLLGDRERNIVDEKMAKIATGDSEEREAKPIRLNLNSGMGSMRPSGALDDQETPAFVNRGFGGKKNDSARSRSSEKSKSITEQEDEEDQNAEGKESEYESSQSESKSESFD